MGMLTAGWLCYLLAMGALAHAITSERSTQIRG
jgi:hypothetical protein